MNELALQQRQLRAAIVDESAAGTGLRPGSRLHIYQQAYRARLVAALRDNFGVLPEAMGDETFDALAVAYLQAHPSRTPSIRWFGEQLADFMAGHEALVPHPAFVDLARMEWALRAAFDAPDAPVLSGDALVQLSPEQWPALVLRLHPSTRLLELDWAVEPAWRSLQAGDTSDLPEPQAAAHLLLVWRPVLDTCWRSATSPLEAQLLQAVGEGEPFAVLCERAARVLGDDQAATAVVGLLQQWVAEGLLAGET